MRRAAVGREREASRYLRFWEHRRHFPVSSGRRSGLDPSKWVLSALGGTQLRAAHVDCGLLAVFAIPVWPCSDADRTCIRLSPQSKPERVARSSSMILESL